MLLFLVIPHSHIDDLRHISVPDPCEERLTDLQRLYFIHGDRILCFLEESILNINLIVQTLCPEIIISDKIFHCIPERRQYDKSRRNNGCCRTCKRRRQVCPPDHLGNAHRSSNNGKQKNNY